MEVAIVFTFNDCTIIALHILDATYILTSNIVMKIIHLYQIKIFTHIKHQKKKNHALHEHLKDIFISSYYKQIVIIDNSSYPLAKIKLFKYICPYKFPD